MPDDVQDQDVLQNKLRDLIEGIGEKNDRFGFEMDDDARVWRVYARAAQKRDSERLTQWNSSLDTLLIFAGLFSAVSTTFIIDSYKQMQPDYTELVFRALVAGKEFVEQPFHVTESSRAVNCLWISSLITSLSTALIAILAKQWIAAYPVPIRDNLREWAQLRQSRMDSMELWRLPELIAVIPVLLHASLLLFLTGLVVFLLDIDTGTMALALVLTTTTFGLYACATFSPVLWDTSPFRTLPTPVLLRYAHWCLDSSLFKAFVVLRDHCCKSRGLYVLQMAYGTFALVHHFGVQRLGAVARATILPLVLRRKAHTSSDDQMLLPRYTETLFGAASESSRDGIYGTVVSTHAPWDVAHTMSFPLAARALSWLAETAETTAIYNAALDALGDTICGPKVSPHLSCSLRARFGAEIAAIAPRRNLHEDKARYLRVAFHLGYEDSFAPLVEEVETWMYHDELRTRFADTIVRANILDTSNAGLETGFSEFAFDHWSTMCTSAPHSVLQSTAYLVIQWFTENWVSRLPYLGGDRVAPRLLILANAWRSHFAERPSAVAKLLELVFSDDLCHMPAREASSRCGGDQRYCILIDQLATILAHHTFPTITENDNAVERTLKAQTFDSFIFFLNLHGCSDTEKHPHLHAQLSEDDAISAIAISGDYVLPLLYSIRPRSLPTHAQFNLLTRLLDCTHTWHLAGTNDPLQPHALDQCVYLIDQFVFGGSSNRQLALRSLVKNGRLEPLSRATTWNSKCLFLNLMETLTTMATTSGARSSEVSISEGRTLLVDTVVSDFVQSEGLGGSGPEGTSIRRWDLASVASDYMIHLLGGATLAPWYLDRLCNALCDLRQRYPELPCWEDIAERVYKSYRLLESEGPSRTLGAREASTLRKFFADVGRKDISADQGI